MYRTLPPTTESGLQTTIGGRLYPTRQPEPEWLRRKYEQAEAVKRLQREQRAKQSQRQPRPRTGLVGRVRSALGLA
ncbi:MAG TPA: hypothetical protein PJ994_06880 [Tepidiformaceae bacterium]|nr:hypothetical protein [Tepidiformaceae bacterium]